MPYEGAMATAFRQLSPDQQTAVYQYVLFLVNTPSVNVTIHEPVQQPTRVLGPLANRFRGISDNFDEPLPAFEEYMQ